MASMHLGLSIACGCLAAFWTVRAVLVAEKRGLSVLCAVLNTVSATLMFIASRFFF
jgi:hypothetical protein